MAAMRGLAALLLVAACSAPTPPPLRAVAVDAVHDFGRVSGPKTMAVTLRNAGTAAVAVTAFENETGDAAFTAEFSPFTLAVGARVSVPVTFSAVDGSHEATFVVRFDGGEVRTRLVGVGVGDCAAPSGITFGNVAIGDVGRQSITIRNSSANASSVHLGAIESDVFRASEIGTIVVAPGEGRTIDFSFTPTALQDYATGFTWRSGACPEQTVLLTGAGVREVLSCDALDFGYVFPGAAATRSLMLRNIGQTPVTLVPGSAGSEWTVPALPVTVPGNSEAMVPVTFKPTTLGIKVAMLPLSTSHATQRTLSCRLRGGGGGPDIEVTPRAVDFGEVPYFATGSYGAQREIVITNVGIRPQVLDAAANLKLGAVTVTPKNAGSPLSAICVGRWDAVSGCTGGFGPSYAPGLGIVAGPEGRLAVPIRVLPDAAGKDLEWDVAFASNDLDEPTVTVNVKARAVALPPCQYTVTPSSIDFGTMPGQPREQLVTIRNDGTAPDARCLIDRVALAPGTAAIYSLATPFSPLSLAPGASTSVTVRASAVAAAGAAAGTLEIFASSPVTPVFQVPITGSVVPTCVAVTPASSDWGVVQTGCNGATRTFRWFTGCANTTVTGWAVTGSGFTAGASGANGVDLTYAPSSAGAHTGALRITAQQDGQAVIYEVPLQGRADATGANVETFTWSGKVDVLLVMDEMFDVQDAFAKNVASFLPPPSSSVDWQLGLIRGVVDWPLPAGELLGSPVIMRSSTPNVQQSLADRLYQLGRHGAFEGSAEPARLALTPPMSVGANAGFLRPDAALAIVGLSQDAEYQPAPADFYAAFFGGLKPRGLVTFHIQGPFLPQSPSGCSYACGSSCDTASRHALLAALDGLEEEICTTDWPGTLARLGAAAFNRSPYHYLAGDPAPGTLSLEVGGVTLPASAWARDPIRNAVTVAPPYRPATGAPLTVRYVAACH